MDNDPGTSRQLWASGGVRICKSKVIVLLPASHKGYKGSIPLGAFMDRLLYGLLLRAVIGL